MALFSERTGLKPPKVVLQLSSMDDDLRNGLWNACELAILHRVANVKRYVDLDPFVSRFLRDLWANFRKQPTDTIPPEGLQAYNLIREFYFRAEWFEVYDFIEFIANHNFATVNDFIALCDETLERERSGYRFVGRKVVRITSEQELAAVQTAQHGVPDALKPVRLHLTTATGLFSDRKSPDYRNSIKESISAVEAMCKILIGDEKATLGQALKQVELKGIPLHTALKSSFNSLYGYTNDADGIRHAMLEEPTLDFDDAKYMLVSCSAFVNYLAAKAGKVGAI